MAKVAVVRPLAEPDLRDELRLDPLHVALAHARQLRLGSANGVESRRSGFSSLSSLRDLGVVEAGADVADVAQLAAFVDPEDERAEGAGALAGCRACSPR